MLMTDRSTDQVPIPALLVQRAIDLARAEAGLALIHTRRVAVRAVSALLGTIVACAFAQLTIVLLVAWPVLATRVPAANLFGALGASVALAIGGAAFAIVTWARSRERTGAVQPTVAAEAEHEAAAQPDAPRAGGEAATTNGGARSGFDTREPARAAKLTERVSL